MPTSHTCFVCSLPRQTWERSRRLNFSPIEALASNDLLLAQTRGNGRFSASKLSNLYPRVNAMQCFAYPISATSVLLQAEAPICQRASRSRGSGDGEVAQVEVEPPGSLQAMFELRTTQQPLSHRF